MPASLLLASAALPCFCQISHPLLDTDLLAPSARLVLHLHAGGYTVRTSGDGRIHVTETRDGETPANRSTEVRFRPTRDGARLEIEPPTGQHRSPQVTVALPGCASLDLTLTAGEIVFETVPCEETSADVHTGEVRAMLGDPAAYRSIKASVAIGEVDAPGLGKNNDDEQHGGFSARLNAAEVGPVPLQAMSAPDKITLARSRQ